MYCTDNLIIISLIIYFIFPILSKQLSSFQIESLELTSVVTLMGGLFQF